MERLTIDMEALTYREWVTAWPEAPHFVYTLSDSDGRPFYVGRTGNPRSRMSDHRRRRRFGRRARFCELIACSSIGEAMRLEVGMIRDLDSTENVQHRGRS